MKDRTSRAQFYKVNCASKSSQKLGESTRSFKLCRAIIDNTASAVDKGQHGFKRRYQPARSNVVGFAFHS
jgi:hypothetical protein